MPGPLEGIRVIDVSAIVSGPLATTMLATQGADVIKVEPLTGDGLRGPANSRGGMNSFFASSNRGKRSISLNLKSEEGLGIIYELVKQADVFVQNWRPGVAEQLKLSEQDLRALNKDLIYASVSGYGDSGPLAHQPVYDPVIQAITGYVALQKNPKAEEPDLVRNIEVDKASALILAQSITAALFARDRGAGGQSIHVPMIDVGLWFLFPDGGMKHTLIGDGVAYPGSIAEIYRLWKTQDGHIVQFAAAPHHFDAFACVLGHPEWLEEPRYLRPEVTKPENRAELNALIEAALIQFTTADIVEKLQAAEVPVAAVLTLDEVFEHEQIK
ncbi:MAG: CoA transferase, partial [Pseudomonadota bacterium]